MPVPLDRSALLQLLLHGPYRFSDADAGTDSLRCRECKETITYDRDVPPVGSLIDCPSCGLPSRVPISG